MKYTTAPANILLVDDQPANLVALEAVLDRLGCNLVKAHSGQEALKWLMNNHDCALILMDVQMPGMDGFQTASLIKEREKSCHIPIIFVTAVNKEQQSIFQGYSTGAVDYIAKPFDATILKAKVAVFVDLFRYAQQSQWQGEQLLQAERRLHTERRVAERHRLREAHRHLTELAASEARLSEFKSIMDATLDGVFIFDAHSLHFSYMNHGGMRQLGYDQEEILTLTPLDLLPEQDAAILRDKLTALRAGTLPSYTFQAHQRRKDGTEIPVEVFLQFIAPQGKAGRFVAVARDVRERQHAEARQSALLQGLNTVVAMADELLAPADLDGLLRQAVELARRKLGLERCSIYLLQPENNEVRGTYGTDMHGQTSDERDLPVSLDDHWIAPILQRDYSRPDAPRWFVDAAHELVDSDANSGDKGLRNLGKTGWIAATPIFSAYGPIGILFNDTALSNAPVDNITQELVVIYCSLLGKIIERKRTEEKIRRGQAQLAEAQRIAHLGSWEWDLTTNRITWSDEMCHIFGITPHEFHGTYEAYLKLVHPDDRERVNAVIQHSCQTHAPFTYYHRVMHLDGTIRIVDGRGIVVTDPSDQPIRIMGTAHDMTELNRIEQSLHDAKDQLQAVLDAVPGAVSWISADLKYLGVNQYLAKTHHIAPGDFVGQGVGFRETSPEFEELVRGLFANEQSVASREVAVQVDDLWRTNLIMAQKYEQGRAAVFVGVDITEHKQAEKALLQSRDELEMRVAQRTAELERANVALQEKEIQQQQVIDTLAQSEERFRLLVESVHDYAIFMLDTTGHVMTWNEGAQRLKGYGAEDIIGQHFACFYTEADLHAGKPERALQVAATQDYYDDEGWRVRQDGSRFWATIVLTALRDDYGQLRGFAKVSRDITEQKQIEVELQRAKQEAEAANLAKSEFLSRMSHELRTPLNAILGFGQLLTKQDFAPAQQERVQHIMEAGRHLLNLINEVLDIARIEAGHIQLSLEPVPVRETVQEVFSLVRPLAAERGIELQGSEDADLAVYVQADRQRLKQVLLNLCSNAIKYNRPQGTLTLTCQIVPGGLSPEGQAVPDQVRINVTDTGLGIAVAAQAQLFVPFMRVGAEQTSIEGTGLGLALSRSLTHAMGGTIGVDSTVGVGSTFWLQLPLTPAPLLTGRGALALAVRPVTVSDVHYTLLYIEDNLSNLRLIEDILTDQPSYKLLWAMQGQLGLDLARQHRPDLILLDLHLQDIHGDQILARLKADPDTADIPVVMLSAVAMEPEIERLLDAGASAYLTKPLDVDKFLDTLADILRPTILQPTIGSV